MTNTRITMHVTVKKEKKHIISTLSVVKLGAKIFNLVIIIIIPHYSAFYIILYQ